MQPDVPVARVNIIIAKEPDLPVVHVNKDVGEWAYSRRTWTRAGDRIVVLHFPSAKALATALWGCKTEHLVKHKAQQQNRPKSMRPLNHRQFVERDTRELAA
jgi:hypothetical protein